MSRGATVRAALLMVGDVTREKGARAKHLPFVEALARQTTLVSVLDVALQGLPKVVNALSVFHPNRNLWRQRFYLNERAFAQRTQLALAHARRLEGKAQVILQQGVLFDSAGRLPTVIYTDYTAQLSARNPAAGRSPFAPEERRRLIDLEKKAMHNAAHICTRSELVRQAIVGDYRIAPERVTTVGAGVNFSALPAVVDRRGMSSSPTALFIGSEFFRKGGDQLLQAFAIARREVPQAQMVMVTADRVPPTLPTEGVRLLPPIWNREALAQLYRQADVFVLPSRLETWGDVLLEAMSFGLPCIGIQGQAMEEIIAHNQTGYVVPPNDITGLAQALIQLFRNSVVRQEMGRAARRKVEANFTWETVCRKIVNVMGLATN